MDRREFTKIMGAVVAGMVAGSKLSAEAKKAATKAQHAGQGMNSPFLRFFHDALAVRGLLSVQFNFA